MINASPARVANALPRRRIRAAILALAFSLTAAPLAGAAESGKWIGTWSASPQPLWGGDFAAPLGIPANLWKQTLRQVVRTSLGGQSVRIVLSNEYGTTPLVVGAAHVALADKDAAVKEGGKPLTFSGNATVTIPPGAPAVSDPVDLVVPAFGELAVSLYFPEISPATTMHWDGHQHAFIVAGDKTATADFKPDSTITSRLFLSGVMVDAPAQARAVVTFGDSITDGDGSTLDANHRWPDLLAKRLAEAGGPPTAVLNQGISGAKVLSDRMGVNALARFDRDVLSQPRVDTVILMMGINDIGWPASPLAPKDAEPTAEQVIDGYEQLIARAKDRGIRIVGATLTPFNDAFNGTPLAGYYDADKEKTRTAVNSWIRSSGAFDGVIDFDAVVRDPADPTRIQKAFDKGDNLHPNDAGYEAMAKSIDLKLLAPAP